MDSELTRDEREWMASKYASCLLTYAQIGKQHGLTADETRDIVRQTVANGHYQTTLGMIDKLETSPKLRAKVAKHWMLTLNPAQIREIAGI